MSQVFPAQRNYRFSSSLMNLKFMKRTNDDADVSPNLAGRDGDKVKQSSTMIQFEANRREMEARMQLPSTFVVQEEHSFCRLYDLVNGRFAFKNNTSEENSSGVPIPNALDPDMNAGDDDDMDEDASGSPDRKRQNVGPFKRRAKDRNPPSYYDPASGALPPDTSRNQYGRYFTCNSKNNLRRKRKREAQDHAKFGPSSSDSVAPLLTYEGSR